MSDDSRKSFDPIGPALADRADDVLFEDVWEHRSSRRGTAPDY